MHFYSFSTFCRLLSHCVDSRFAAKFALRKISMNITNVSWNISIGSWQAIQYFKKIKGHTLFLYRAEFKGQLPDQSKVNLV